jgi:hypothetical protein
VTVEIPSRLVDILGWDKKAFAALAFARVDGRPHVTPVWFDYVDGHLVVNTARGRVKDRAMHRRAPLAISMVDPQNPYRYVLVHGKVVSETEEGGYEQICHLNLKYHGTPDYPKRPGEVRVTYRIEPVDVYPKE